MRSGYRARDDVLVFTGPVISEPQEVIGPVSLRLRVRGSSPDFDVFARLCDVDAKGTLWNICDGLLRLDATPPADADGWTEIEVPMSATAHRFAPGHRLRVQVSGGAHPAGPATPAPRADRDGHDPRAGGHRDQTPRDRPVATSAAPVAIARAARQPGHTRGNVSTQNPGRCLQTGGRIRGGSTST